MKKSEKLQQAPAIKTNNILLFSILTLIWFCLTTITIISAQIFSQPIFLKLFWICTTACMLGIFGTIYLKWFQKKP